MYNAQQSNEPISFNSELGILRYLIGLIFVGAGAGIIYAVLTGQGSNNPPLAVIIPFCSLFIIFGLVVMFGRRGTIIDPSDRTITKWWGLLFPFNQKSFTVEETGEVQTIKEIRRGNKSNTVVYVIKVQAENGNIINVLEVKNSKEARQKGEQIAKVLNLALRDNCLEYLKQL